MHFADSSVYIWCAMILAVYDISKAVENGKPIEPIDAYTTGAVRYVRLRYIPGELSLMC